MGQTNKFLILVLPIFLSICLMTTHCSQSQHLTILENGLYFNGVEFVKFREIVIEKGKIQFISTKRSSFRGHHIDLSGGFVIPGLIDAHVHISGNPLLMFDNQTSDLRENCKSCLKAGVTTFLDLFFIEKDCLKFKNAINDSPQYYPSALMAGPMLTAPGGHGTEYGIPTRTIEEKTSIKQIVSEVLENGADIIKIVYQGHSYPRTLSMETLRQVITQAHVVGKKVIVHIFNAAEAVDCASLGADALAHIPADSLTSAQIQLLATSGVIIVPTLSTLESFDEGHSLAYMSDSLLLHTINPSNLNFIRRAMPFSAISPGKILNIENPAYKENLRKIVEANIKIIAGTDAGNPAVFYGYSLHDEIMQYVSIGMTPAAAINSATANITFLFPKLKTGKISVGYDADIVVLEQNPLVDISATKNMKMIFHKGFQVALPYKH